MPPTPPGQAPALPDELIEDIFLRLPTDEPASLVRASLANKHWHGLLTGPRFRSLYREFHGSPPMLGFLYSWCRNSRPEKEDRFPRFVSTTSFAARIPDDEDWKNEVSRYSVRDCRHGRVLLCNMTCSLPLFVVWDPKTGCRRELDLPPNFYSERGERAAVLCTVRGCDHSACHEGPFRVVLVDLDNTDDGCVAYAHMSLPDVCGWSKPCSALDLAIEDAFFVDRPPIFIQDALYFMLIYLGDDDGAVIVILKYDLGSNCLSLIDAPPQVIDSAGNTILMAIEDGSLGFAHVDGLTLNLWSRNMGSNGVAAWIQRSVIDLKSLIPIQNPKKRLRLIGSVEGTDVIFVTTDLGIYEINLKSLRWKKIWEREEFRALIPYMSFYNPPERVSRCDAAH